MKRLWSAVSVAVVLGLSPTVALAYSCPILVKACETAAANMEKRADADKAMVAEAKKGCGEAQKLHDAGKHKEAQIRVGEAISMTGKALK